MDFQLDDHSFYRGFVDTLIKGSAFLHSLGPLYYARTGLYIVLSAAAVKIANERFHAAFAIFAASYEILLILKAYMTIS